MSMKGYILLTFVALIIILTLSSSSEDVGESYSCVVNSVDLDGVVHPSWVPCFKLKIRTVLYNNNSGFFCDQTRCLPGRTGKY